MKRKFASLFTGGGCTQQNQEPVWTAAAVDSPRTLDSLHFPMFYIDPLLLHSSTYSNNW